VPTPRNPLSKFHQLEVAVTYSRGGGGYVGGEKRVSDGLARGQAKGEALVGKLCGSLEGSEKGRKVKAS